VEHGKKSKNCLQKAVESFIKNIQEVQ